MGQNHKVLDKRKDDLEVNSFPDRRSNKRLLNSLKSNLTLNVVKVNDNHGLKLIRDIIAQIKNLLIFIKNIK